MQKRKIHKKDLPRLKKYYRFKKRHEHTVLSLGGFILCLSFIAISWTTYKVLNWNVDNKHIESELNYIADVAITDSSVSSKSVIEMGDEKKEKVDLSSLANINSDVVSFLKVEGTDINYPVVQTQDNDYYLTHSFLRKESNAGWVFMDYRNDLKELDDNTIIYAHGGSSEALFGSLKNVLNKSWFNDINNHYIKLLTFNGELTWKVFAVYKIPTETYYLTSNFGSVETHSEFINTIKSRSLYDFKVDVDISDKILTLSTCYNNSEKVVLHAKLISDGEE